MKIFTPLASLLFIVGISSVVAWWDHGHQLIPAIVKMRALEKKEGAVELLHIKRIEHLMRLWQAVGGLPVKHQWATQFPFGATLPDYAKLSSKPEDNGFERSIADGIKDNVHYFNIPFDIEKPNEVPAECQDMDNNPCGSGKFDGVTGQLDFLYGILTGTKMNKPYSFTLETYLNQFYQYIHFMGDLHQPLHMTALKGGNYKEAPYDMGGNSIRISDASENPLLKDLFPKIVDYEKYIGLHQLWDSMIWHKETDDLNSAPPRVRRCINYCETYSQDLEHNQLYKDALKIMEQHDCSKFEVDISFYKMGQESYDYGRTAVYAPVEMKHITGETPEKLDLEDKYIKESHDKIIELIAKAACRLEFQLHKIFEHFPYESLIEDLSAFWKKHIDNDKLRIDPVMPETP